MSAVVAPVGGLRRQLAVAAVALAGVYAVVFGPSVLLAFRSLAGTHAAAPTGWSARVAALEWDVFAVAVVYVVVLRWLPSRAPELRPGLRTRIATSRFALATAAYVAVTASSVWLGDRVVAALHLSGAGYTQLGDGAGSAALTAAASVAAGVTEEITLVALPVAVIGQAAVRSRCRVPATLALMLVLRLLPHLYYGWTSVFVVAWTVGAYAVFRWAGSIWPLVLGHVLYDWVALALALSR